MRVVTVYLVIAGFWTWIGLWWIILIHKTALIPNLGVLGRGACIAFACFASAYALYRRSRFAIPCIVAIPITQWLAFASMYPSRLGVTDTQVDFAYFRQLPPVLVANIIFYSVMTFYALWLWRRRNLI